MNKRIGYPEIVRTETWNRMRLVAHPHRPAKKNKPPSEELYIVGDEMLTLDEMFTEKLIGIKEYDKLKAQNKVLTCMHPEDRLKRAVRGRERRLECKECGTVLLKVEVHPDGIKY